MSSERLDTSVSNPMIATWDYYNFLEEKYLNQDLPLNDAEFNKIEATVIKNYENQDQHWVDPVSNVIRAIDCIFKKTLVPSKNIDNHLTLYSFQTQNLAASSEESETSLNEIHRFHLLNLPIELLDSILTFIPYRRWDELQNIAMSCKKLFHLVMNPLFLKKIFKLNSDLLLQKQSKTQLFQKFLNFTEHSPQSLTRTGITDQDLIALSRFGSQLITLTLIDGNFTPDAFSFFLSKAPNLKSITFQNHNIGFLDLYAAAIVQNFNAIKEISLIDCEHVTDSTLFCMAQIKHLESFVFINSLERGLITDFGISFLINKLNLTSLKITGAHFVSELGVMHLFKKSKSGGCEVREFGFSFCGPSSAKLFNRISTSNCNLVSLEMGFGDDSFQLNPRVIIESLVGMLKNCNKLENLTLNDNRLLIDIVALSISKLPALKSLNIIKRGTYGFNPWDLVNVANKPKQFRIQIPTEKMYSIDLSKLKFMLNEMETFSVSRLTITNELMTNALQDMQVSNLRHLHLNKCGLYASSILSLIGKKFPKLVSLEIFNSQPHLKDESINKHVIALLKGCRSLEHFGFDSKNSISSITIEVFSSLNNLGLNIQSLTLHNLSIKEIDVEKYGKTSASLSKLKLKKLCLKDSLIPQKLFEYLYINHGAFLDLIEAKVAFGSNIAIIRRTSPRFLDPDSENFKE